ncbi:RecX family transcriptional regulator [Komagataeibacter intermedius]|uniref:RecX family transcriptional regulator n=1 Tax=Acetobacteraceae TaxID=433 RepID=UPI0009D6F69D|nr:MULTISPECIES: RecX family transcriptional regulator [Acetobacteraceae]MCF3636091.1 RecX family transcriptional regulator [Komagataeibacter intermedius]WEQ54936.1 RecX family transcriptional regulator [Komagataeibacter nataicola]
MLEKSQLGAVEWMAALEKAGRDYLARFPAGRLPLERVLLRRIERQVGADHEEQVIPRQALQMVLDAFEHEGLFAVTSQLARERDTLMKRGCSARMAVRKLAEKGAPRDALSELDEADPELEFQAALNLARKRHIGPYRREEADRIATRKEEGILARAGFGRDVIRRIIEIAQDDLPDT